MNKLSKLMALLLVLAMAASVLAGCSTVSTSGGETATTTTTASEPAAAPAEAPAKQEEASKESKNDTTPLVVGYSPVSEKFSPFFSETAYDQDVWLMTQVALDHDSDRPAPHRQAGRCDPEGYRRRDHQL